jgi:predicted glycogen debranching enzyme
MDSILPSPIVVALAGQELEPLLGREWLMTNKLGSYCASTVVGCNTRRYHGLLIAATLPPVGRVDALSTVMEQVVIGDQTHSLAVNEFSGAISPRGDQYLVEFRNEVAPTFVYRIGGLTLVKELILAEAANALAIRYTLRGGAARLLLWPFAAMRDYHHLRKVSQPHQLTFDTMPGGIAIQDRQGVSQSLHLFSSACFEPRPQWWYQFLYRQDIARGMDGMEDLYTPGHFVCELSDGQSCQLTACVETAGEVDFDAQRERRRARLERLAASVGGAADELTRRLAVATDAFTVMRSFPGSPPSPTIVAGYPWFGDWGRDSFISLLGLLEAGQFEHAKGVFKTFGGCMSEGMIANVYDDYSHRAHYNSIDASLWFVQAAVRYLQLSSDREFWRTELLPAAERIMRAYETGTKFDIHADADGLLSGGSSRTQLTWMDAKLGDEAITPRHGKAVEINALWHSAHRLLAEVLREDLPELAAQYAAKADRIAVAFARTFWNESANCLYDCITQGVPDASIRPNQIFAVSLPHSPLSPEQQGAVVKVVREHLLTPYGLRTLSPFDPSYRRAYGGSWESRDRAYHQGTVWAWLMGPFIDAYLKVEGQKPFALAQARQWLSAFDEHLRQACLGQVSEIFDGDPPHTPRGCFAQAWSVCELLRAKLMVSV